MNTYKYATVIREYITELDKYKLSIKVGKKEADTGIIFIDNCDSSVNVSAVEYDKLAYIIFDERLRFDEVKEEIKNRDISLDDYDRVPDGGDDI